MTHPGTLLKFLACSSLMICAFSTTGFPGATFSPSRYLTVVENFDWVLMTWGGCFSTTRELKETLVTWVRKRCVKMWVLFVALCELGRRNSLYSLSAFSNLNSKRNMKMYPKENNVTVLPLNQNLQKLPQPFLKLWDRFHHQHQFLSQLPVHTKQLLTPNRKKYIKTVREQERKERHKYLRYSFQPNDNRLP